jgi:hypothetical protein
MIANAHQNYTLDIISHHPQFDGKTLRKYVVDGISTIGAWEEEFSVVFRNNTAQKIETLISIDGINTTNGKLASTNTSDERWVVQPYGVLELKAWRESDQGGAAFRFTNSQNSVAAHTTGDLSSLGIIAAAVFVEGEKPEPIRVIEKEYVPYPVYPIYPTNPPLYPSPWWEVQDYRYNDQWTYGKGYANQQTMYPASTLGVAGYNANGGGTYSSCSTLPNADYDFDESNVGVGAGQYTSQPISYVVGLTKPVLTETIRVRFMWWNEMVEKLRAQDNKPVPQPSGFPADKPKGINLKQTPRISDEIRKRIQKELSKINQDKFRYDRIQA